VSNVTAVIGLAGRFAGDPTFETLRSNLCHGTGPAATVSGREPWVSRTRLFLDCAAEALQHAACANRVEAERTGLFAGGDEADGLATDVASTMGLGGPVVTVQNPASAALAAIDRACRSLRSGECDLALAGEISLRGEGEGVMVLKRLPDALADGDQILAVIRGSAVQEPLETSPMDSLADLPAESIGYVAEIRGGGMAGMSGLLTAVLAVERGRIPPALDEWPDTGGARRALVSALDPRGAVQVVLEQPPAPVPQASRDPAQTEGERGPLRARPVLANTYNPPTNRLESAIASVWQDQLGVDLVGVDDNFFEIGGTSIAGVKIIAVLKEWLHQDIPTVSLYEGPTVSALARVLLHSRTARSYDAVRERGERRRRRLQKELS